MALQHFPASILMINRTDFPNTPEIEIYLEITGIYFNQRLASNLLFVPIANLKNKQYNSILLTLSLTYPPHAYCSFMFNNFWYMKDMYWYSGPLVPDIARTLTLVLGASNGRNSIVGRYTRVFYSRAVQITKST